MAVSTESKKQGRQLAVAPKNPGASESVNRGRHSTLAILSDLERRVEPVGLCSIFQWTSWRTVFVSLLLGFSMEANLLWMLSRSREGKECSEMITSWFKKPLPLPRQGIHVTQRTLCPPKEMSGPTISVSVYSWESFQLEASLEEEAIYQVHKTHQKLQKMAW